MYTYFKSTFYYSKYPTNSSSTLVSFLSNIKSVEFRIGTPSPKIARSVRNHIQFITLISPVEILDPKFDSVIAKTFNFLALENI